MILIDTDSRPNETILYLSAELLQQFKKKKKIPLDTLDKFLHNAIHSNIPMYKLYLSLDFLYLLGKIEIIRGDIIYVSKEINHSRRN